MLRGPAGIVILAWPFARLGFSFLAMGCDNGSTGRLALDMKGCQGWTFLVLGFGGVAIEFNVVGGTDVRWGCGRGKIALTAGVRWGYAKEWGLAPRSSKIVASQKGLAVLAGSFILRGPIMEVCPSCSLEVST